MRRELNWIIDTKDPSQLLLRYSQLPQCKYKEGPQPESLSKLHIPSFEDIMEALSDLRVKLQAPNPPLALTQNELLMHEPKSREEFLRYAVNITMDQNTMSRNLLLNEENQTITKADVVQDYPDHPDQFGDIGQVLSKEALTGRCYFEVQWNDLRGILGLTYRSNERKGNGSIFGMNIVSWAVMFSISTLLFHNRNKELVEKSLLQKARSLSGPHCRTDIVLQPKR